MTIVEKLEIQPVSVLIQHTYGIRRLHAELAKLAVSSANGKDT